MTFGRLQTLFPLILPKAPGCPGVTAAQQARLAAIEFCERSRCWREITTVTVDAAGEAALVAPPEAAIFEIEQAEANGAPLLPTQHTRIHDLPAGAPAYITQVNPNAITVFPTLGPVDVRLSLFLKPTLLDEFGTDPTDPLFNRYDVVPDWLLTQHGHRIADGALGRILAIPGEPWTDLQRAAYHAGLFEEACTSNFRQQIRGQQRARRRSSFQGF